MNSQPRHVDFLDTLRGIAIVGVFGFHAVSASYGYGELPWAGWLRTFEVPHPSFVVMFPAMFGSTGVALFFVVSGFCIHLSFQRTPDWRDFFWRRFFRIYPPYLFAVLCFAFVYPLSRLSFSSLSDYANLASHLLLFHNLHEQSFFGINPAFWSIAVEAQLYLVYPIVLILSRRQGWKRAIALLAVIEIALRVTSLAVESLGGVVPRAISGSPFAYWFSWSIGAYIAEEFLRDRALPFSTWSIGGLAVAAFGSMFFKPLSYFAFTLFSLLTAAIMAQLLSRRTDGWRVPAVVSNHLRLAGVWSFSLYLLHQPLLKSITLLMPATSDGKVLYPLARLSLCIASWFIILPLAGLAYRWCEQPSIAFGKRLLHRNDRLPSVAPV